MKQKIAMNDLRAEILKQLRSFDGCEEAGGVHLNRIADPRSTANWEVKSVTVGNATHADCVNVLARIVPPLQAKYELVD